METCESCPREVRESEAAVSRRALGGVYCCVCRMRQVAAGIVLHEAPQGCRWLGIRASGYGQWTAPLCTPDGQVFHGFGWSDVQAMMRATMKAREAGAL